MPILVCTGRQMLAPEGDRNGLASSSLAPPLNGRIALQNHLVADQLEELNVRGGEWADEQAYYQHGTVEHAHGKQPRQMIADTPEIRGQGGLLWVGHCSGVVDFGIVIERIAPTLML